MTGSNSPSQDPTADSSAAPDRDHDRHDWQNPARMPTRFGVGLMLLFLTLFSVGFCILKACGTPPVVILFLTLLFTVVGFAQILWPQQPRWASAIAGGMYLPPWMLAFIATEVASDGEWKFLLQAAPMSFCSAPLGSFFGYLAGALLAGIFLKVGLSSHAPAANGGATDAGESSEPAAPAPQA